MLCTRHAACYIADVPTEKIAKSAPELMIELDAIFADYKYSPNSIFEDLISKIGKIFYEVDPLGVVEKGNSNQIDEYFPEADMLIWLHFSKKLTPRTFWAIWEYQFADSNPYFNEESKELASLYSRLMSFLR